MFVYMVELKSGSACSIDNHKPVPVPGKNWNWFQVLVSPIEDVFSITGKCVADAPTPLRFF